LGVEAQRQRPRPVLRPGSFSHLPDNKVRFQEQESSCEVKGLKTARKKKNNHPFYIQKTNKLSLAADGSQ